ncbi:MAG: butyrate kinase [Synergistaceae bacterium]|nr:butyrate kinase [Synergistaceae bacterium]MBP9975112.1 butyrate kinase [Synergistaceae bacterium]MCE5183896.1 butyrate kinase [Synergistaceae bacterium]
MYRILAVNPGSTSTKIAVYENGDEILKENIPVDQDIISEYKCVLDQLEHRFDLIKRTLIDNGVKPDSFDAVVGRGGILAPMPSGTYLVTEEMTDYLKDAPRGEHASNLGAFIAEKFAHMSGCEAYIVDPVSVDELTDVARISGAPEIKRSSLVHALNQKAVARKVAADLGKKYEDCRFVVAHLGTGITIGAHSSGKIVDVVGAKADGPFSPERAGGLPVGELVDLIFSGRYTKEELKKKLLSGWGIVAYLGTRDIREVFKMAENDPEARIILEAFVYQIAKGVGELCTVLDGEIDAVILTGGMAHSDRLMEMLKKKIKFLAPIVIIPGENELEALYKGAERVLRKEERPRIYPGGEYI